MKISVASALFNLGSVAVTNADFNGLRRISRLNTGAANRSVSGVSEARKLESSLVHIGDDLAGPLDECQGDCDTNDDCKGDMVCYQRYQYETVPGCSDEPGEGNEKEDYCAYRPDNYLLYLSGASELGLCEGSCDTDGDCVGDLVCFQRSMNTPVPGCDGTGRRGSDYCIINPSGTPPTNVPTKSPTNVPTKSPTSNPVIAPGPPTKSPTNEPALPPTKAPTNVPTKSPTSNPVIAPGLPTKSPTNEPTLSPRIDPTKAPTSVPTKSPTSEPVIATGLPTTSPTNEPTLPPTIDPTKAPTRSPSGTAATYVPGELTIDCENLKLSTGMACKLLTAKDTNVELTDGTFSADKMHRDADGAGVVPHLNDGGWYYMSNSERGSGNGGVGTLRFAANGDLIGYERTLTGTSRNCGGGVTYWNTWVSCEENGKNGNQGFCYEVDPHTGYTGKTKVVPEGGNYESFAYDNEDPVATRFFVTEDTGDGPLVRYTPHANAYITGDNHDILKTDNGIHEYLVLDDNTMTFRWSTVVTEGETNADDLFPNAEGIDVHNRILSFVSKERKMLFTLDLAAGTWFKTSTFSGAFDMQPDQIGRILGDSEALYFCEDGGTSSDIHGRDATGQFFTVVKNLNYSDDGEETTGLAFSPDGMFMYVAYQENSHIYSFWRTDGLPFNAAVAEIKYH